ncbi:MAG: hypothetical protein U0R44_04875 [Candidatus Micrarchaeia archaeon]
MSRLRYQGGRKEHILTDGKIEQGFRSDETIPQGTLIRLEGEMTAGGILARKITVLEGDGGKSALERIMANISESARLPEKASLLDDDVSRMIWPRLREAALKLITAKKLGRSVMLRFHGDADGISGAFAITSVAYCKAFQQNSAIYSVRDALRDIAAVGQESRPLVILLDFGSSDSCREALSLLSAGGIEYLVIDHHPYNAKEDERIINPFSIDENASKYTAGYLACEIAVACGLDRDKALELAKTACSGDKSTIIENGDQEAKRAMVLDFLASHVSFGNNLDFYKKVMESTDLFSSIAASADESIEEAAEKAVSRAKRSDFSGVETVSFSLEGIARKGEWPPSSKITTRVFDKLRGETPIVCIGITDRSLIIRLNDQAAGRGLSANTLAEKMKKAMADFIEGGGGHTRAGAIRAREGFVKDVLGQLLKEIEGTSKGS